MSSKDKIEEATQELDTTVGKKAAGSESSIYPGILNFNDYNGKSSTNSRIPIAYKSVIQDSMKKLENEYSNERRAGSMEDNKLLEIYMEKVDKDQRDLKEDIRESERRNQKRVEESDKRMDEKMGRIVDMLREQNQKIDKIDTKIESVSKEVSSGLSEYRKFMWGIAISIFLAIAAMILTIIL